MYKIGVVGPNSSVERIINLGKEYESIMEFKAYPYEDFRETEKIVLEYNKNVDVWFFQAKFLIWLQKYCGNRGKPIIYRSY